MFNVIHQAVAGEHALLLHAAWIVAIPLAASVVSAVVVAMAIRFGTR